MRSIDVGVAGDDDQGVHPLDRDEADILRPLLRPEDGRQLLRQRRRRRIAQRLQREGHALKLVQVDRLHRRFQQVQLRPRSRQQKHVALRLDRDQGAARRQRRQQFRRLGRLDMAQRQDADTRADAADHRRPIGQRRFGRHHLIAAGERHQRDAMHLKHALHHVQHVLARDRSTGIDADRALDPGIDRIAQPQDVAEHGAGELPDVGLGKVQFDILARQRRPGGGLRHLDPQAATLDDGRTARRLIPPGRGGGTGAPGGNQRRRLPRRPGIAPHQLGELLVHPRLDSGRAAARIPPEAPAWRMRSRSAAVLNGSACFVSSWIVCPVSRTVTKHKV